MTRQEQELKVHIEMLNVATNIQNGILTLNNNYKSAYGDWVDYANTVPMIYSIRDYSYLQTIYTKRVKRIAELISSISDDKEEIIINTLEINRLLVTYDFILGNKNNVNSEGRFINSGQALSGSGIIPAFTGRGICQNQSAYCRDILNSLGIDANTLALSGKQGSHADVLIDNNIVIDPTNFHGEIENISGGEDLQNDYNLSKYNNLSNIDPIKFNNCVAKSRKALIEFLGIRQISNIQGFDNFSNEEKQMAIWRYIAKNIKKTDKPENSYTVSINGFLIEITSALELFYTANNIPFTHSRQHISGAFEHEHYSIINTVFGDTEVSIIPRRIIKMGNNFKPIILPIVYSKDFSREINLTDLYLNVKNALDNSEQSLINSAKNK